VLFGAACRRLVPFGVAEAKRQRTRQVRPRLRLRCDRRVGGSLPFTSVWFRLPPITSFSVPEFGGATEPERRRAGALSGVEGIFDPLYPSTRPRPHFTERS
jgi:hypothetical protein